MNVYVDGTGIYAEVMHLEWRWISLSRRGCLGDGG